jgi:probable HAF family extracellular repeat protein
MRFNLLRSALAVLLLPSFTTPLQLSAQQQTPRYKLVALGTLGGPISYGSANGDGGRLLNNEGVLSSYADTSLADPFAPDMCFDADCLLAHAYRWRNGVMKDLGSLADGFNSLAASINDRGWSLGASQSGILNPAGFPQNRATLWIGRRIVNLGVVHGGSDSIGISVNNAGQAVGISNSDIPDPFSLFGIGVQIRTFLWEEGQLQDIGTLGGPDAVPGPGCNNQRPGTVVGVSYTSFTPNEASGIPTQDPFLWENGKMRDLGNLGGTVSFGQCANNRGEVIGISSLAENPGACPGGPGCHAFLWAHGSMKDLGTLGGGSSEAIWINDSGVIAGSADLPTEGIHDAVRWKGGQILDLGTVDGDACSRGRAINERGQVVGGSSDCANFLHAFVWEEGGPMIDLNTVIPPGSGLQLTNAFNINDRGEILAKSVPEGVTPIDDEDLGHVVLLIPCEQDRGDCVNIMAKGSEWKAVVSAFAPTHVGQQRTMHEALRTWRERFSAQHGSTIGSER